MVEITKVVEVDKIKTITEKARVVFIAGKGFIMPLRKLKWDDRKVTQIGDSLHDKKGGFIKVEIPLWLLKKTGAAW